MKSIDIFIHDSLHTPQTMKYEFEKAWPHIRSGGLLISDDIGGNSFFASFVKAQRIEKWFSAPKAGKEGMFGVAIKE